MVETSAHLTDHVFPGLPVRQWVLLVPKRLRYFSQNLRGLSVAVPDLRWADAPDCVHYRGHA
ncbi:MAG: hypothetical protein Q8R67_19965, partial [Rhodoferax sp.]